MPRGKVDGQPAYVLHARPYRETSLLVEVFTRDYGRVVLIARGARRPRSALRGLLMGFQPLELGWSGKGEVLTLMKAEWQGGMPLLAGLPLFCAYYLNELLLYLLPREDPHQTLFTHYAETLLRFAASGKQVAEVDLRRFEKALLQELGYGLTLDRTLEGMPVRANAHYRYEIENGPVLAEHAGSGTIAGQTLLELQAEDFSHPRTRLEAKQLMRRLINYYLDGLELETRKIFKELQEL